MAGGPKRRIIKKIEQYGNQKSIKKKQRKIRGCQKVWCYRNNTTISACIRVSLQFIHSNINQPRMNANALTC